MGNLRSQRNIASKVLKSGKSRIWINPAKINDLEDSITTADIKRMIKDGTIVKKPKTGLSSYRKKKIMAQKKKGRRKGKGSKKGHVRGERKRKWIKTIRALRNQLTELRDNGKISKTKYRELYLKSKSGFFRSKKHLISYVETSIESGSETNILEKKR